jgi:hypothetical protein
MLSRPIRGSPFPSLTRLWRFAGMVPLLGLIMLAQPAQAQIPYDGCVDRQGRKIEGIISDSLTYPGWAMVRADGTPVIYWNPRRHYSTNQVDLLFLYLHECGHHALGHVYRWGTVAEQKKMEVEADCWAMQLMVDGGMIKGRHLEALEADFRNSRGDAVHLGGTALIQSWRSCLNDRTDGKLWRAALDSLVRAAGDSFASIRGAAFSDGPGDTVSDSRLDLPAIYDCTINRAAAFVCMIFAARENGPVLRRYRETAKILRSWLPPGWTSAEQADPTGGERMVLRAEDSTSGMGLALILTDHQRLYFVFRPPSHP